MLQQVFPKNKLAKRVSGARVLTSKECVEILKKKEKKWKRKQKRKRNNERSNEKKRAERIDQKAKRRKGKKKAAERDSRPKKQTNKSYIDKQSPNASSPGSAPRAKRKKPVSRDSDIDINQCCVCFQTFEDDEREHSGLWVESRWLHEECIEYHLSVNSMSQELLCPCCCL